MRLLLAGIFTIGGCLAQDAKSSTAPASPGTLTVSAGTKIMLGLTSAIWTKSARPGQTVYSETTFPVAIDGVMAIPPGTYIKGTVNIFFRPSAHSGRAEFRLSFAQAIFANGYTVALAGAFATVNVSVAARSDVLLDNGSQFEMVLEQPLTLNTAAVAAAARMTTAPKPRDWKTASLCRPVPATPGTPDTYIPGTPGTAPTVIPSGPGMPGTVIPGIPGTPATVIHGMAGSPGFACPGPPAVTSAAAVHKESFYLPQPVSEAGQTMPAGSYEVTWEGLGPVAQAHILKGGKPIVTLPSTVTALGKDAATNDLATRNNPDGSFSLELLQFKGRNFALRFDP